MWRGSERYDREKSVKQWLSGAVYPLTYPYARNAREKAAPLAQAFDDADRHTAAARLRRNNLDVLHELSGSVTSLRVSVQGTQRDLPSCQRALRASTFAWRAFAGSRRPEVTERGFFGRENIEGPVDLQDLEDPANERGGRSQDDARPPILCQAVTML